MNYKVISLLAGLVVWLGVTLSARTIGHYFLVPDNALASVCLIAGGFFAMALVSRLLFRSLSLLVQQAFLAAILLVLPGLLLDAAVMALFAQAMPNLPASMAGVYAGLLLAAKAGALAGAISWPIGKHAEQHRHPSVH